MAVQNYYIALTYKLYVKDEEDEKEAFAEQCDANRPFTFISHLACVLPAFEQKILGLENIDKVVEITQDPIGRTPRSNPATYTGVFDDIRELFI